MSDASADDTRRLIDISPHEFQAYFNYNSDGLQPWFACHSAISETGKAIGTVESCGTTWEVELTYHEGGIDPVDQTPNGTEIEFDSVREFHLNAESVDNDLRSLHIHLAPRWKGQTHTKDDGSTVTLNTPNALVEHRDGASLDVKGSNIEFADYLDLVPDLFQAVGIHSRYFRDPHETSNIYDAARYVRILEDKAGPIHGRAGPLVEMAHVLENDRSGYRELSQKDTDDYGQNRPGYMHKTRLGEKRIRDLWPNHQLPKECKFYYERNWSDRDLDDPLRHPKLEVSFEKSLKSDTFHLTRENIEQAATELEESIYAILADAGIDLRANENVYIADDFFSVENATTEANIVDIDVATIKHEQENIVVRHLSDGLSPVEQECLETAVTDGGVIAPEDIAEEWDRHVDSVRRALRRREDLFDRKYGEVGLRSGYVADLVHDAIEQARDAFDRATDTAARALEAAERGIDERTSAFVAWAAKYGISHTDTESGVKLDLGQMDADDPYQAARRLLREGEQLWQEMGRDLAEFRMGRYRFTYEETVGPDLRSVDTQTTQTQSHGGRIWQTLR